MEVFEIHITGDKQILAAGEKLGVKTIAVDLVKPDRSYFRTEYMTSIVYKCENYKACLWYVDQLLYSLRYMGVKVCRAKIECPWYDHYVGQSLYLESHFDATDNTFPLSRNQRKTTFLATDRTYDHTAYKAFMERWKDAVKELCLFDSNVAEDADWFNLYKAA